MAIIPDINLTETGRRPNRAIPIWLFSIAFMGLFAYTGIQASAANLPAERKLEILSGVAYFCLLVGVINLRKALHLRKQVEPKPYSVGLILLLAYVLPGLITWTPKLIAVLMEWSVGGQVPEITLASFFLPSYPWLLMLQSFSLLFLTIPAWHFDTQLILDGKTILKSFSIAAIFGIGLWLVGSFIFQLTNTTLQIKALQANTTTPLISGFLIFSALAALPLGEGFLRLRVLDACQKRSGWFSGSLLSALILATVQVRPFYWLSTIVVGWGLNTILQRNNQLPLLILVHIFFNAIAICINPMYIL